MYIKTNKLTSEGGQKIAMSPLEWRGVVANTREGRTQYRIIYWPLQIASSSRLDVTGGAS